eukprot:m.48322 g.48322  ORF g.48322 m.48322 type:complete len:69 (+) comp11989_c0_seq1:717-923(+)
MHVSRNLGRVAMVLRDGNCAGSSRIVGAGVFDTGRSVAFRDLKLLVFETARNYKRACKNTTSHQVHVA